MRCKNVVQQNVEWSDDQFAIKERVNCHQGYLRKYTQNKYRKVKGPSSCKHVLFCVGTEQTEDKVLLYSYIND